MKTKIILLFIFPLIISCSKNRDFSLDEIVFQTIDISYTCPVLIENATNEDKYFVINTQRDFEKHVIFDKDQLQESCPDLCDDFIIDFSKYTLLIGKAFLSKTQGTLLDQSIERDSSGNYIYNIRIKKGGWNALGQYKFGVLVPKIPQKYKVRFNVIIEGFTG